MSIAIWILALSIWRFGHIEERWAAGATDAQQQG
jgi:hypothetical protein